jgi:hypothetical protein
VCSSAAQRNLKREQRMSSLNHVVRYLCFASLSKLVQCNQSGSSFSKRDSVPKVFVAKKEAQRSRFRAHWHKRSQTKPPARRGEAHSGGPARRQPVCASRRILWCLSSSSLKRMCWVAAHRRQSDEPSTSKHFPARSTTRRMMISQSP